MQRLAKLLPALLLGSALGGCSMAGSGDFFADEYAQSQSWGQYGQSHYGQGDCGQPQLPVQHRIVAPAPQRIQAPCGQLRHPNPVRVEPMYTAPNFAQPSFAAPTHVQPHFNPQPLGQPSFGPAAYVAPALGAAAYGLRGLSKPFSPYAYGNLGVVNYEAGEDLYGAQARVGYQFSKYLGVEGEGSLGLSRETDTLVLGGVPFEQNLEVENSLAGFGVLRFPLLKNINGYGRAGYHHTKVDQRLFDGVNAPIQNEFNVDGLAYGAGLELDVSPRTAVRLDYTVYDFEGPDADAISLAVSRKF